MSLPFYQYDSFAEEVFRGNPAAVCLLEEALPDALLQAIAAENNLSETAFLLPMGDGRYGLRWFTPTLEVDLCGHATLAAATCILEERHPEWPEVRFDTLSGELRVVRHDRGLEMDFPSRSSRPIDIPTGLEVALGARPHACRMGTELVAFFRTEEQIRALSPDIAAIAALGYGHGAIVTAPGKDCDFVSRFFAPLAGIDEDPVTGAAHCLLTPCWADRLGRTLLEARQVSAREGRLQCESRGDRVLLRGRALKVIEGRFHLSGEEK